MLTAIAFISSLTAWVVTHQSVLLMVATALLFFEQWLAQTDKLKSNSTLQLLSSISVGIVSVLRIIYKISTGKAMITMLDGSAAPVAPAIPTPAQVIEKAIESPATKLDEGQIAVLAKAVEEGGASIANLTPQ